MNNKFYKNIACALILACSVQTIDLQCGWFESITGQITTTLTGIKTTIQKNQTAAYIAGGLAITALIFHYSTQKFWWDNTITPEQKLSVLKPFASEEELSKEFLQLLKREEKLTEKTTEVVIKEYYKDLMLFYQRLFRYIVKKDIENKLAYTIDLGFKVTDGKLEMARLPTQNEFEENQYLFTLSIDPQNEIALEKLKNLIKQQSNPSKNKDSVSFFPEIVLLSDDSTEINNNSAASYLRSKNKILIRKANFSISACFYMIHEFTHRLQVVQVPAKGGLSNFGLLNSNADYASYPHDVALEIEADTRSLTCLPKESLNLLLKKWDTPEYSLEFFFPYFTTYQSYGFLLEHLNLTGKQPYAKAGKNAYKERKNIEKQIIDTCSKLADAPENEQNSCSYQTCLKLVKDSKKSEDLANGLTDVYKKILLNKPNLTVEQKEKINTATNNPAGSTEFFKLKQEILA